MYTGEMFVPDATETALAAAGIAADVRALQAPWRAAVDAVLAEATLRASGRGLRAAGRQAGRAHRAPRPPARRDAVPAARVSRSAVVMRRRHSSGRGRGDHGRSRPRGERGGTRVRSTRSGTRSPRCPTRRSRSSRWSSSASCAASNGPRRASLRRRVTPTYSGCPATELITDVDPRGARRGRGRRRAAIETALSPAWTTDWITPEAQARSSRVRHRAARRTARIARRRRGHQSAARARASPVACPRCGSTRRPRCSRSSARPPARRSTAATTASSRSTTSSRTDRSVRPGVPAPSR